MPVFYGSVATSAVTSIFIIWRAYCEARYRRSRIIHERVAQMLWAAAEQMS
jgi:hypothetical protein